MHGPIQSTWRNGGGRKSIRPLPTDGGEAGGTWRFVQRDAEGNVYAFNGAYREVVSPERLVYTFEFEGMPGHILVETVTFREHDGKTELTNRAVFETVEERDGMFQSGMESGGIRIDGSSGCALGKRLSFVRN